MSKPETLDRELNRDTLDDELPTAYLEGDHPEVASDLPPSPASQEAAEAVTRRRGTDWLLLLTAPRPDTAQLADDPPRLLPRPSGMLAHSAPPRISPTLGSKL